MDFHIIIPTYNRKLLLDRTLKSVLNQKNLNFNYYIYIIDDWSIDWTNDFILDIYNYKNIFYFYKNNWWVSSARNFWIQEVLKKAKIEDFILFLDSDDELLINSLNIIYNKVIKYNYISYFAFWVENQLWESTFYNFTDNQILNYKESLSELNARWEFFRIIKVDILRNNSFTFPEWLNWWEFFFRLEINKIYDLLVTNEVVRIYYQDNSWITRDLLDIKKVNNFLKVTKFFIDNYWYDLFNLNKKLLWIHYLVYSRMLSLSWNRFTSLKFWFKWFIYSFDFIRLFLYLISLLPYGINLNNLILKLKKIINE